MEICENIKKIEQFLTPRTLEKENIVEFFRDTMEYIDHLQIDDAYFTVSIIQKDDYLIFDELDQEEKRLNYLIEKADKISKNENNTLDIKPLNTKQKLKSLLYFRKKLIEELNKEDRCDMIYLLYGY